MPAASVNKNTYCTASDARSTIARTCARIASTSNTVTLGNRRTSATSAGRCARDQMDAGHVGAGGTVEQCGGNTRKKFGRKLSQRTLRTLATRGRQRFAGDVEIEIVADRKMQRIAILGRDRHPGFARHRPASTTAGDQWLSGISAADQVRFCSRAANAGRGRSRSASMPMARELIRVMRALITGYIGASAMPWAPSQRSSGSPILRPDVDQEVVRGAITEARTPAAQQVATDDREQQQDHQAEPEGDDLHDARDPASRDVREPVAPGDTDAAAEPAGQAHQRETRGGEHDADRGDPGREVDDQGGVAHHQPENRDHGARARAHTERAWRQGGGAPFRRSTRTGGVCLRGIRGGSAKPSSMTAAVTSAISTGVGDAGGRASRIRSRSSHAMPDSAPSPIDAPAATAISASTDNSTSPPPG